MKQLKYIVRILLLLSLLGVAGCRSVGSVNGKTVYAIRHVTVIPITVENGILQDATVVIEGNTIISINGPIPSGATIIDGKGKYLIPGLTDMHVHNLGGVNFGPKYATGGGNITFDTQDVMLAYIANGVTTVLDLNANAVHFGQREEIKRGKAIGPRMALAALINGGEGDGRIANTAADGRQSVRMAKAEGYEFIKVYSQLNKETFFAILDEAEKQGMKVVGHIPNAFQGSLEEAITPQFGMVAHAEEYTKHAKDFSDAEADYFASLAKKGGTWLTPTLTIMDRAADQARSLDSISNLKTFRYVHPLLQSKWLTSNGYNKGTTPERVTHFEQIVGFNEKLVRAFKTAGVPMVAGTDAGSSGVVWGFSLHDELELLVNAGLTPKEALASATRLSAVWLGIADKIGTVEEGKWADLILLDANPLEDIRNTRKLAGVFVNGRWLDKATIDKMLADLAKRNTADKGKYEWKKRREYGNR